MSFLDKIRELLPLLAALLLLGLGACSTAQVTATCQGTEDVVRSAQPFLEFAPMEIRVAVWALGAGSHACGTPEYAAMRERVIGFIAAKRGGK
jgi:hypothetical protein